MLCLHHKLNDCFDIWSEAATLHVYFVYRPLDQQRSTILPDVNTEAEAFCGAEMF